MGSGFAKKKKEARALQESFSQMQDKLKETRVTGSAGGNLVNVTLNGEFEMVSLRIEKECIDPEDAEGLEDLIRAAFSDAWKKAKESSLADMPSLPFGL